MTRCLAYRNSDPAYRTADEDAAAGLLQRRWFAAFQAASRARAECEALLDAIEISERAWNEARVRLAELEMLRDMLGEELANVEDVAPGVECLEQTSSAERGKPKFSAR